MSGAAVLNALLGPSLKEGRGDGSLVEVYTNRLLEFGPGPIYAYLFENSEKILATLPKANQKAAFVLGAWRIARPEDWAGWASEMPSMPGDGFGEGAAEVVAHMLKGAADLEPEAARSVREHLNVLKPVLASLSGESEAELLAGAARKALAKRDWWSAEEVGDSQSALHELVRAIESLTPKLADPSDSGTHPLRPARFADINRAPMESATELRTVRILAVDLLRQDYAELWERIPEADAEEQPVLFAERVLTRLTLERRERGPDTSRHQVSVYMKEMQALAKLGADYRAKLQQAAITMIDLQPRPYQLWTLVWYLGARPGEQALAAGARWAERSERKEIADALERMIHPRFDASEWAGALSESPFTETPVLRKLSDKLLDRRTKVRERVRMAAMTRTLRLTTQNGTDQLATLITKLLAPRRFKEDLRVVLVLCEGLGPDHDKQPKIERALINYAKRYSHKFKPAELPAIAASGVEIPDKYLSQNTLKQAEGLAAQGLEKVRQFRSRIFG
jgi:hypothetical protein